MRTISIILFSLILNFNAISNKKADNIQSDSLKLKISQMLIFGIGDLQKVLESDSMLDAYSKNYLGGIILFEKNINKKRGKHHLKILIDEVQRISQIPSFVAIDEEGGKVNRLKSRVTQDSSSRQNAHNLALLLQSVVLQNGCV